MDVNDADAHARFGLVLIDDLPAFLRNFEQQHGSHWSDLKALAIRLESLAPTDKRTTDVVFDRSLRGDERIFHRDD